MLIAIPSLGRWNRPRTWDRIPRVWRPHTRIFVQPQEAEQYRQKFGEFVVVIGDDIHDIATTRDWICWYSRDKLKSTPVLMMDDDLDFATRRHDDPSKFVEATEADMVDMLEKLDGVLHSKAHVALAPREGANRNWGDWLENTRAMRVIGFRPEIILKHSLYFAPGTFMCDFHMTLELLKLGYDNVVLNQYIHNQPGSNNVPGGCTGQRTPELQRAAAEWLARRHHPFVTVVKKTTKTSWEGQERYDVRVQWKAAFNSSRTPGTVEVLDGGAHPYSGSEEEGAAEAVDE